MGIGLTGSAPARLPVARQVTQLRRDVKTHCGEDRRAAVAQAVAPILQAAAYLREDVQHWAEQPDDPLLEEGRASAQGVQVPIRFRTAEHGGPGRRAGDTGCAPA